MVLRSICLFRQLEEGEISSSVMQVDRRIDREMVTRIPKRLRLPSPSGSLRLVHSCPKGHPFSLLAVSPQPHLFTSSQIQNIIRLLILNLLAATLYHTFTSQPCSTPLPSPKKRGDQPPIASSFANPEFNRLAISNNPP
jgi:hypothetical protein